MAIDSKYYVHKSDKAALKALKAIPGFHQFIKAFMKIWSERQFRITNMSSCIRINENQMPKYYNMLPPICEKLGIDIPELYLELDVVPNAYTYGDTNPFIVITSGLIETVPEELIPTVLAHECGHIACHHTLYTTMGNLLLRGTESAIRSFIPYGSLVALPLEVAFSYWMRCSELSADRAAVICDGTAEKTSEMCMRFAGYDKDISAVASKEEFMKQAQDYRDMISSSKWDKTLEFLFLIGMDHPLSAVRALECEEWAESEQFQKILDGTFLLEEIEDDEEPSDLETEIIAENGSKLKKQKAKFELPSFMKKQKTEQSDDENQFLLSVPDEIRKFKELMDDGIITEEEFEEKKRQLLDL